MADQMISRTPTRQRRIALLECGDIVGYTTRHHALTLLRRQDRDAPDLVGDGALSAYDIDTDESVRT